MFLMHFMIKSKSMNLRYYYVYYIRRTIRVTLTACRFTLSEFRFAGVSTSSWFNKSIDASLIPPHAFKPIPTVKIYTQYILQRLDPNHQSHFATSFLVGLHRSRCRGYLRSVILVCDMSCTLVCVTSATRVSSY